YYYFRQWEDAGVFEEVWTAALAAFDEQVGLDWTWQSIDGCMTKAPLGGGNQRAEPHRPRQVGDETERAYGRRRDTHRHYGRWRQSARLDLVGRDAAGDGRPATDPECRPPAASLS